MSGEKLRKSSTFWLTEHLFTQALAFKFWTCDMHREAKIDNSSLKNVNIIMNSGDCHERKDRKL